MRKFDIELYDDNCAGGFFNDKEIDISFEIDFTSIYLIKIKGCPTFVPYGNDSVLYDDGVEYEIKTDGDVVDCLDYTIEDGSKLSAEEKKELIQILNKLVYEYLKDDFESFDYDSLIYKNTMME